MGNADRSLLRRFFLAGRDDHLGVGPVAEPDECPHTRLMGRYRGPRELERGEAMGYKCQLCYREFLPADPVVTKSGLAALRAFEPTPQDGTLPG